VSLADRKERERKQRLNDIVNAAEKLFFSRGYDNVSMNDIADEVELSKATLYLYFKDKESLFFAIALRGARILNSKYDECSKLDIAGLEKIKAMGQGILEFSQRYPDYFRMLSYSGSERFCNTDNYDAVEISELTNKNIALIRGAFEQGMKDGTIRSDMNPLEMAIYLCITSLCIMNLDPRWKKALDAAGISHDQFVKDFRCFIGPSIESSRQEKTVRSTSDHADKYGTSQPSKYRKSEGDR
jgi:TetR/AcrR family transcriptional regulator